MKTARERQRGSDLLPPRKVRATQSNGLSPLRKVRKIHSNGLSPLRKVRTIQSNGLKPLKKVRQIQSNGLSQLLCIFLTFLIPTVTATRLKELKQNLSITVDSEGTWKDTHGNTADRDSRIRFVPYTSDLKYESNSTELISGAFYDLARSIAVSGWSEEYPLSFLKEAKENPRPINFDEAPGYLVGVGWGLLFTTICLFAPCCCLCYCCCGGCRPKKPSARSRRQVARLCVVVSVLATIGFAAAVMFLKGNTDTQQLMPGFFSSANSLLQDFGVFVKMFLKESLYVFDKLDFAEAIFHRDLDNMNVLMAAEIKRVLMVDSGLGEFTKKLHAFGKGSQDAKRALAELQQALNELDAAHANLGISASSPNLSATTSKTDANAGKNVTAMIEDATQELEKAPEKIKAQGTAHVETLRDDLTRKLMMVRVFRDVVEGFGDKFEETLEIDKKKKKLKQMKEDAAPIETARYSVTLCVGLLAVTVAGLLGAGVICAIYERKSCAACCVKSGVTIFLSVGVLTMALSTLLFALASPLEKLLCEPVRDTEFKLLDRIIAGVVHKGNGTFLASSLGYNTSNVTTGRALRACRNNSAAYTAFDMEHNPKANINRLLDFRDQLNVSQQVKKSRPNLSAFKVLDNPDIDNFIKTFENGLELPPGIDTMLTTSKATTDPMKPTATPTNQGKIQRVENARANVRRKRDAYNAIVRGPISPDKARELRALGKKVDQNIATMLPATIEKGMTNFANRMLGIVDSMLDSTKEDIYERNGRCRVLYNAFQVVMVDTVCTNVLNVVNGMWLSLGWWTVSTLFTCISATKLIRQMRSPEASRIIVRPTTNSSDEDVSSSQQPPSNNDGYMQQPYDQYIMSDTSLQMQQSYQQTTSDTNLLRQQQEQLSAMRMQQPQRY